MVPVVFGTAWLVVTMLLGLVSSWGSLLPSANQKGKTQRVTRTAARGPCAKHQESNPLSRSFIPSFSALPDHFLRTGPTDAAEQEADRSVRFPRV